MTRLIFPILLLLCCLAPRLATAQFAGMKQRIPTDANTVILIDADKLFGSAIADRQGWQARRRSCL